VHHPGMPATHLTASMRVIRAHLGKGPIAADAAHDIVKELALRVGSGRATSEDESLAAALQKATHCTLAELAALARQWPDSP
jgi:hypothetical protein